MSSINHQLWLDETSLAFSTTSETAVLDARVLLCFALDKPLSYLLSWPEREIADEVLSSLKSLKTRRLNGEPIAYITGIREFWSLDFKVTPEVLIPRPETERLVEFALDCISSKSKADFKTLELGTGSGAISVALASEHPELRFLATDYSQAALVIASGNANRNQCNNIDFVQGSWFDALENQQFDLILSNPPYVAPDDPHLSQGDLPFEPIEALVGNHCDLENEKGLADIEEILKAAKSHLLPKGQIALEHGYDQAQSVQSLMKTYGYVEIKSYQDLANIDRITTAKIKG